MPSYTYAQVLAFMKPIARGRATAIDEQELTQCIQSLIADNLELVIRAISATKLKTLPYQAWLAFDKVLLGDGSEASYAASIKNTKLINSCYECSPFLNFCVARLFEATAKCEPKRIRLALQNYQSAANAGCAQAMYRLAQVYFKGDLYEACDPPRAVEYLWHAAAQRFALALYNYGTYLMTGLVHQGQRLVACNPKFALFYFQQAASQNLLAADKAIAAYVPQVEKK